MKKNLTEIVFILDRSGSMSGLEKDTIGGYNSMLKKQKEEKGEATVTTVLFDGEYELLHDRIPIQGVDEITEKEYYARGVTALLDAIGLTINKISKAQQNTKESQRAEKVMFVITTDGYENASKEYSYDNIKALIEKHQGKYGWEFMFLGANIDAISQAKRFGIHEDHATNYRHDSSGTDMKYKAMTEAISEVRRSKKLSKAWKKEIEEDFEKSRE